MDEKERYEQGMKKRRQVLGDTHVDRAQANRTDFTSDFQDLITRYAWGEIWTRPGLPAHTRSLMTICGGLLVGLSIRAAVEYSFLLGVLTLTAATAKDAVGKVKGIDPTYDTLFGGTKLMIHEYGTTTLLVGLVAAAISAALAVKWLVSYLQSHGLACFGWYRIVVGVTVAGMILSGVLTA